MNGVTLNTLITAMLSCQPYNQPRLGREAKRYARKLSNRYGRDLVEDLHEEVFTEAFAQLFANGAAGLATRTGISLYRSAVLEAIRCVRASYTPAGARTRAAPRDAKVDRIAAEAGGHIVDAKLAEQCLVSDGEHRHFDVDRVADPIAASAMQNMIDSIDVERSLARAPASIAAALRLVYFDDTPKLAVAEIMGISRFALERRFRAFGDSLLAAA